MPFIENDRVYFLLKDPHWTFIWWKITPATINRVAPHIKERGQFTIRVHDVTDLEGDSETSDRYFDIHVTGETDHWYLRIPVADRTYRAEVGFKVDEDRFYALAKSSPLTLPRDCPSESKDAKWNGIGGK